MTMDAREPKDNNKMKNKHTLQQQRNHCTLNSRLLQLQFCKKVDVLFRRLKVVRSLGCFKDLALSESVRQRLSLKTFQWASDSNAALEEQLHHYTGK